MPVATIGRTGKVSAIGMLLAGGKQGLRYQRTSISLTTWSTPSRPATAV